MVRRVFLRGASFGCCIAVASGITQCTGGRSGRDVQSYWTTTTTQVRYLCGITWVRESCSRSLWQSLHVSDYFLEHVCMLAISPRTAGDTQA